MEAKKIVILNAFTGACLGLLVGFLLGLSLSPVVGAVAAVLVSGAVVFMGLSEKSNAAEGLGAVQLWRIAFLALFCWAGTLGGLWFRTHNVLGLSPSMALYQELTEVGLERSEVLRIVADRARAGSATKDSGPSAPVATETGLYSVADRAGLSNLDPRQFTQADDAARAFQGLGGGPAAFAEMARKTFRSQDLKAVLQAYWDSAMAVR